MQKTRVLMLATTLPAEPGDGTPEFVLELAQHMNADVTILAPRAHGCPKHQRMGNVNVIRFPYGPKFAETVANDAILPAIRSTPSLALQVPGLVLGMAFAAWRAKRQISPDVLHAHWIIPAGLIGAALTARGDCQLLVTAHGADAFALHDRASLALKRFVLRRADHVHAVSTDIANKLETIAPSQVATVLPIGVDVNAVAAATAHRRPNGRLLFVGRLAEKKGVDILLRALASLHSDALQIPLDIIGDGPQRLALEMLCEELGLSGQVTFHGSKQRHEVLESYRVAELLVMPSKTAPNGDRDGTPVVLMEAIAAKLPIIASDVGGIGELLVDGDTAWIVAEGNVDALADAIRVAVVDPNREQVAARCLKKTIQRIDVSEISAALLEQAA